MLSKKEKQSAEGEDEEDVSDLEKTVSKLVVVLIIHDLFLFHNGPPLY